MVDHDAAALRGSCFLFFSAPTEAEATELRYRGYITTRTHDADVSH